MGCKSAITSLERAVKSVLSPEQSFVLPAQAMSAWSCGSRLLRASSAGWSVVFTGDGIMAWTCWNNLMTPASVSLAAPAIGAKADGIGATLVKLVLISLNTLRTGPKAAFVTGVLLTIGVMAAVMASMAVLTAVTCAKQSGLHVWSGVVVVLQPAGQATGASGASPAPVHVYSEVTLNPQLAGKALPQT